MTIWRLHIACWIIKATDAHRLCNTHCFSTETMVERTRLSVTFYIVLVAFTKKCCRIMLSSFAVSRYFYIESRESVNRILIKQPIVEFY
jgi:hypothetical protein